MSDINKQLKHLQLSDWSSFIEDINYNFSVLISSPLFVGTRGKGGKGGTPGQIGLRGSRWFYVNLDIFKTEFPDDNLFGEYQITETYLNNKMINPDNRKKLFDCFDIDMFVTGDMIISNSKILMVDLKIERPIVDTGNSVSTTLEEVIQSDIINQVTSYINDKMDQISREIELSYNVLYETHAKNYSDSSGYINNTILGSSIFDIDVTGAKAGVRVSSHKTLAPREMAMHEEMTMTQIIGSPIKYHNLIQRTLSWDESQSNNTTSNFGPSRKSLPSLVVLQNDYTNGIMFGHRDEDNFTQFGKIYIASTNSRKNLTIVGPNTSNHNLSYSHIKIYDNVIDITSAKINLKGNVIANGNITMLSGTIFEHQSISWTPQQITIGSLLGNGTKTLFNSKHHYFEDPKYLNADFLSITNKELIINKFSFDANTDITAIANVPNKIPNTQLIRNLRNNLFAEIDAIWIDTRSIKTSLNNEIANRVSEDTAINLRITNLIDGSVYTMQTLENHLIQMINDSHQSLESYINNEITDTKADYNSKITAETNSRTTAISGLTTQVNTLDSKITTETNSRTTAISTLRGGYTGSLYSLKQDIESEVIARSDSISSVRGGYEHSLKTLYDLITNITPGTPENIWKPYVDNAIIAVTNDYTNKISTEATTRSSAITSVRGGYSGSMQTLYDLIQSMSGGSDSGDWKPYVDAQILSTKSDYNTKINAEASTRSSAITSVRGGYSGSMQTLYNLIKAAETDYDSKINTEASTRSSAITSIRGGYSGSMQTLYNLIQSLSGGSGPDDGWVEYVDTQIANTKSDYISRISTERTARQNADTSIRGGYNGSMKDLHTLIQSGGNAPRWQGNIPGTIIDLYIAANTIGAALNILFDSSGQGKTNVSYDTPVGRASNVNLSHLWVCDGRNNLPNLVGYVTMFAGPGNPMGGTYGSESIKLERNHIPTLPVTIPGKEMTLTMPNHSHSVKGNTKSVDGHYHTVKAKGKVSEYTYKWGNIPVGNTHRYISDLGVHGFNGKPDPYDATEWTTSHWHEINFQSGEKSATFTERIPDLTGEFTKNSFQSEIPLYQPTVFVIKCMVG